MKHQNKTIKKDFPLTSISRPEAKQKINTLRKRLETLDNTLTQTKQLSYEILEIVVELHQRQAWISYGLKDWETLVKTQNLKLNNLEKPIQNKAILELAQARFSSRAIAPIIDTSHSTVLRTINELEQKGHKIPSTTLTLDGKNKTRRYTKQNKMQQISTKTADTFVKSLTNEIKNLTNTIQESETLITTANTQTRKTLHHTTQHLQNKTLETLETKQ